MVPYFCIRIIFIEWKAQNGRGQLNNLLYYQPSITSRST
jgi:hypothetical protein